MTPEKIAEARRVIAAATAGPWVKHQEPGAMGLWVVERAAPRLPVAGCGRREADAAFLAAARTGWPEALDEVERLRLALGLIADTDALGDAGATPLIARTALAETEEETP